MDPASITAVVTGIASLISAANKSSRLLAWLGGSPKYQYIAEANRAVEAMKSDAFMERLDSRKQGRPTNVDSGEFHETVRPVVLWFLWLKGMKRRDDVRRLAIEIQRNDDVKRLFINSIKKIVEDDECTWAIKN